MTAALSLLFAFFLFVLLIVLRRTHHVPSKEVVFQIHSMVDTMIAQAKLLEDSMQTIQLDVDTLKDEVAMLKDRSDDLCEQINKVRDAIKQS